MDAQPSPRVEPSGADPFVLMPQTTNTLVDDIVQALRDRIISGEMPPGTKIRQRECAEILGVSRTPLREAFQRLEADGWVQLRARRGAEVRAMSAAEAEDIFTLRVLLETFAARVSAVTHASADEARVGALIEVAADEAAIAPAAQLDDANKRFHEHVYGLEDGSLPAELALALRRHWSRAMRYRRFYWSDPSAARTSTASHHEIFHAWCSRDADATERAVAVHILTALRDITRRIDADRPSPEAIRQLAERHGVDLALTPEEHP